MSEVIVITSGKGGVGKTTSTANIGKGLALLGNKVLVIDTDIGLRNLDVILGLENRIIYNLVDAIEGTCKLKQAMIKDRSCPNLWLMPSAQTRNKQDVTPMQMKKLISSIKNDFDYILLDCPAGIEQGFMNAIVAADRAIVVTTPEVSAIRDADRIIGILESEEIKKIELIVNRVRVDMVKRGQMMTVEDICDILGCKLIGVVFDDESIVISGNKGEPICGGKTPSGKAYMNIARRITGDIIDIPMIHAKSSTKLLNLFKKKDKNVSKLQTQEL